MFHNDSAMYERQVRDPRFYVEISIAMHTVKQNEGFAGIQQRILILSPPGRRASPPVPCNETCIRGPDGRNLNMGIDMETNTSQNLFENKITETKSLKLCYSSFLLSVSRVSRKDFFAASSKVLWSVGLGE